MNEGRAGDPNEPRGTPRVGGHGGGGVRSGLFVYDPRKGPAVEVPDCDDPDKVEAIVGKRDPGTSPELLARFLDGEYHATQNELFREAAECVRTLQAELAESKKQGHEAFKIGVGWQERALAAERQLAGRTNVLISGCIAAHGKALPVEKIGELFAAFAKFDAEDWDFLLGVGKYSMHGGRPVGYVAHHEDRDDVDNWKSALAALRKICEAAAPAKPQPTELARLFVQRWAPHLTPAEQREMALSFDQEVAQEMAKGA